LDVSQQQKYEIFELSISMGIVDKNGKQQMRNY